MSFGFGAGDIIAVISLANKIRKEFVDAPVQFKALSDEVRNLSFVVQDVEIVLSSKGRSGQQEDELQAIVDSCRNTLAEVDRKIDKYTELRGPQESKRDMGKRIWKRLKWEPNDVHELRSRISSNIILLNAFYGKVAQNNVTKLIEHQESHEREKILDWLSPVNYAARYSDNIRRRQQGTGQWLLMTNEFQEWITGSKKTLFCPGIPGAGKTILSSIVIEELYDRYGNDSDAGIAYIYCNFLQQDEQTLEHLLANLLKQLAQGQSGLSSSVEVLYNQHKRKGTRPSADELSKALHLICSHGTFTRSFIVIDALDECQISNGSQAKLLNEIFNLQTKHNLNFLATSRFIPEISKKFEDKPWLEIRTSKEDVMRYLRGNLDLLPSFVTRSPELQHEIFAKISEAADGMFLLAHLYLNSLVGKRSPRAIRSALEGLFSGQKTYDKAYDDAMGRIEEQRPDQRELAKQVLSWITCAKRQLTTFELQHALAVELYERHFDSDNIPDLIDMLSVCAGLVTVDQESHIIRVVHYTTQEYFERNKPKWFPNAHRDIATISLTYMLFDTFGMGFCLTDEDFTSRLTEFPLYLYAARNWGFHGHESMNEESPMSEELVMELSSDASKLDFCVQVLWSLKVDSGSVHYSQQPPREVTGLHLAAWFGFIYLAISLVERGFEINSKDSNGRTPLSWAAHCGRTEMGLLLLEKGAIPNSKDNLGHDPLSFAAWMGHEEMVQLLLEKGCDPNSKNQDDQTPLGLAAERGYENIARLLLDWGADLSCRNRAGETPLLTASIHDHAAVVLLLLENGASPETLDTNGYSPLMAAADIVSEEIIEILRASGAQIDTKDDCGRTALSRAATWGSEKMIRLLLKMGANPNSKDNDGRTPLSRASRFHGRSLIQYFLDMGGDPEIEDEDGRTPLTWAAAKGNDAVVALLSSSFKHPNKGDRFGRTPLQAAAAGGHLESVRVLIANPDIDCESQDLLGCTALSDAIKRGRYNVVCLIQGLEMASSFASDQGALASLESMGARWCDICMVIVLEGQNFYHCHTCRGGDFDLCEFCVECGFHCLDISHELEKSQEG